ncbi:Recombinational DNA repair protein RecT [Terribacillus aidingensis]|uniref:Recombinational DNA repair protein RecT n=1 Tax=Terribacillus aidingensis TaxID=586416 RepID=A0A285NYG8_9BACI|nr:RecT family recombinase [Terribacillus aidingensis]SNZ14525.1 Recombinational DNA repair protein RecT [Terribacillus aidingensis]
MANNQNQLSLTPEITEAFKPEVIEVIRNSFAPTATNQEFLLFAHKAASYGLDPFKNEIFFIKYGNTARIQFAAEAYLSKAREQEGFQPPDTQMVHENDEFKVAMNKETKELEVVTHEIAFPRGKVIGAYSIAYREGHRPVTVFMDIDEVSHMFTGQNKENWKKWTSDMFGKHVQQRALKRQYGLEFDDVTIPQGNEGEPESPQQRPRRDVTPNDDDIIDGEESKPNQEPEQKPSKTDELKSQMKSLFTQLGITTNEGVQEYLKLHAPKANPKTQQGLVAIIQVLEMNLEMQQAQASDDDALD